MIAGTNIFNARVGNIFSNKKAGLRLYKRTGFKPGTICV